ncbi:hypothetical protein [Pacificispira sp.]|uniref:hypothetical protein n=1 Tax=Pacificispira sp. TaxID=2888761 RepID=UPI003BA96EBE
MTQAPSSGCCTGCPKSDAPRGPTCGWADSLFLLRGRRLSRRHGAHGTMEGVAEC